MSRTSFIENNPRHFAEITNSDFLYQKAPCGFISFLPDGSILRVNETLSQWIGLSEEEIYKLNFTSLLNKGACLYYQMVITPILVLRGFANEINFTFSGRNGNFDTLFNAVAYLDEKGKMIAVNATLQNISDRKKYEAELLLSKQQAEEDKRRFEFLSDTVPNLFWTALPDGNINFINQRAKDYFGDPDLAELSTSMGVCDEDRANLMFTWKDCLVKGRKLEREIRLRSKDGAAEWFLLRIEPYYKDEQVELWFGSYTNIHKQKLLQLANYSSLSYNLSIAYKTIDTNNEMFLKIAMSQSHMIRKPLANILGLVNLLADLPLTDEVKQLIGMLDTSAAELDMLVKEVVNNTRISE